MDKDIAKRLIEIRKKNNLTQSEFAKKLNATRPKISAYELARVNFDLSFLSLICEKFNVNEEWLRTGKGDMFNDSESCSLDKLIKSKNLTELEEKIVRRFISMDDDIRHLIVDNIAEIFAQIREENLNDNELSAAIDILNYTDKPEVE